MSSDSNPNARYIIRRNSDSYYWNGRNWTRLKKRAQEFITVEAASMVQALRFDQFKTSIVNIREQPRSQGSHKD